VGERATLVRYRTGALVMSARFSTGTRPFFAILGAFVAVAPSLGSGCGSSSASTATPSKPDASVDASVGAGGSDGGHAGPAIVTVVTAGGGANGASSGSVNLFGGPLDDSGTPSDDSGSVSGDSGSAPDTSSSSSSSGSSSGSSSSSSGSSSGSGGSMDSGSDGSMDSGSDGYVSYCDTYTSPMCAGGPCDLKTHTCCITFTLAERCLAGANAKCASNEASVHCATACDCSNGQSCCGVIDTLVGSVESSCQSLSASVSGGNCQPYPETVSQASAQLCALSGECQNGQPCIHQTCVYGAQFYLCGLHSESPYNCAAN
jgi:hypothetical protein